MKDKTTRVFELTAAILLSAYCSFMIIYAKLNPIRIKVDGMKSYTFPIAIYAVMLVCCLVVIAQNRIAAARQKKEKAQMSSEEFAALKEEKKAEFFYHLTDKRVWITVGLIILYAVLWKIVGFLIATLLFVTAEAKVLKKDTPLWQCFLVAVAADVVIYLIFVQLFDISLPETFLQDIV